MRDSATKVMLACASGQLGGTELRLVEEAKALAGFGYQPSVAISAFPQQAEYQALLTKAGIDGFAFNPPRFLERWCDRHWQRLRAALMPCGRLSEADLVHVAFPWTNQGPSHLWMAARCGAPTVISVHNRFPKVDFPSWHRRHFAQAFASVRGIYGVSQVALDAYIDLFGEFLPDLVATQVIYNFVDTERFVISPQRRAETRKALGIDDDVPLIGSIGRFDKQKQPLSLVECFADIVQRCPDAHLLLIGQGDLEQDVRDKIVQLGLRERTILLPFQSDIERYFPALDIHLLLSRNEGFGLVTAEALACGVPVVGTRVSGTTEVIGDCPAGRLVPLGDEPAAATAAVELLSADRPALSEAARRHVLDRFSKPVWLEQLAGFYQQALQPRP